MTLLQFPLTMNFQKSNTLLNLWCVISISKRHYYMFNSFCNCSLLYIIAPFPPHPHQKKLILGLHSLVCGKFMPLAGGSLCGFNHPVLSNF